MSKLNEKMNNANDYFHHNISNFLKIFQPKTTNKEQMIAKLANYF